MKYRGRVDLVALRQSLPVRGAWIEIIFRLRSDTQTYSRSPCGERGLKWTNAIKRLNYTKSLPVRGAWIEMPCNCGTSAICRVAPRAGSVD